MNQGDVLSTQARRRKRAVDQLDEPVNLPRGNRQRIRRSLELVVPRTEHRPASPGHAKQELPLRRIAERTRWRWQARHEIDGARHAHAGKAPAGDTPEQTRCPPARSIDRYPSTNVK